MANWWQYPVTHGYTTSYQGPGTDTPHYAEDLATPFHTPITALLSGTVKQADYAVWSGQPGGGEVFIQPDAGGPQYYFYHLDEIDVRPGQHVGLGDVVGLSGGQNSGGEHPVSPAWSSGPHLHVGFFDKYVTTPAGGRPFGPPPDSLLRGGNNNTQFLNSLGSSQSSSSDGNNQVCLGIPLPIIGCVGQQVNMPDINFQDILYRAGFLIVGILLAFLGLKHFIAATPTVNIEKKS